MVGAPPTKIKIIRLVSTSIKKTQVYFCVVGGDANHGDLRQRSYKTLTIFIMPLTQVLQAFAPDKLNPDR